MRGNPPTIEEPQGTVVSSYDPNPPNQDPESPSSGKSLAQSLVTRCRTLLAELDAFRALLAETQRNPQTVEVRSLRSNALSELRTLEKLSIQLDYASARIASQDDESQEAIDAQEAGLRAVHALKSSNLPFYEAIWTIAKNTCTGLVAFGKRFYWEEKAGNKNLDKRKSVLVDIVADDGEEWVKVSTISETRLLFEMAKKGWEGGSDNDDDGEERTVLQNHGREDDSDYDDDDDDDDEIELLKLASDMRKAANLVRVNYRRPRLRFMIPKIVEGQVPEIDDLLKAIRSHGVVVVCGEDVSSMQTFNESEHRPAESVSVQDEVRNLLPNRFKRFTPTLNVDCTILLAIISDLSHSMEIAPSQQHHRAINRQIEIERERPLLTTELWPAMESHELVCTGEAAQRMREIVETIGTETEKQRMTIVMGDQPLASQLGLPIRIVDADAAFASGNKQAKLPPIAQKVEEILSDINTSVFMYGWVSEIMTITSNRTVVKQIENLIEMHRDEEDLIGPLVWVCDTARSLIGKEKGRKD